MWVTAALWILASAATTQALAGSPSLPIALLFVAVTAVLIRRDLRAHRLPRGVLFGGLAIIIVGQVVVSLTIDEPNRLLGVFGGAVVACVALIAGRRMVPDGPGFGDAAFAALAGGVLGWYGPARVALGIGLGLVLGAVAAGPVTLAVRRQLVTSSPGIGLRPALATGAWLAVCWGDVMMHWYGP